MCGALSITVQGEPKLVLACNCRNCQRRTGSVFGVGAYFGLDDVVERKGTPRQYRIEGDSGQSVVSHFCPNCGSTLFVETQMFQGMLGIPVGGFNEPDFPEPTLSVWNRSKYHWVEFPAHWHRMATQTPESG
ncbi:GFA family protein [Ferrimonas balearica]|uniref:GFA family protein n=1 Tax=Ferrimonas balearica TaxID=44012 RepID=UPI001C9A2028|nr:GFA family protein [Ferrimonas balearica]MBY5990978.1 GFA family protein [Ferrimonas balearica]